MNGPRTRRLWAGLVLAGTLLATAPAAAAEGNADALLAGAIEHYAEAQSASDRGARIAGFSRAAAEFVAAARLGADNAEVHANAGTAALQAGDLGLAILELRRALAIAPRHARALSNLHAARAQLPRWVPIAEGAGSEPDFAVDSAFFWHHSLSGPERLAALAITALLAALGIAYTLARRSAFAAWCAGVPALAWLALAASLLMDLSDQAQPAVMVTETVARAADSLNAPARFAQPLPPGTEVEVNEWRDGWVRVRLANGRDAWLRASALRTIAGPAPAADGG